jgi:hypothetical protein
MRCLSLPSLSLFRRSPVSLLCAGLCGSLPSAAQAQTADAPVHQLRPVDVKGETLQGAGASPQRRPLHLGHRSLR